MNDATIERPTWRRGAMRRALVAGALSTIFSLIYQSPGVVLSPDGWAYWEASVSLLSGGGIHHFGGQPLYAWPPGYPVYLAGWQLVLGNSTATLAVSHAVTLGIAAALCLRAASGFVADRVAPLFEWSLAVTLALVPPIALRAVLSESLFIALLGGALCVTAGARPVGSPGSQRAPGIALRAVALAVLLTCLILTRHQGLAFVPGIAWLFARRTWNRFGTAALVATTFAASAAAAWVGVRVASGQTGSHRMIRFGSESVGRLLTDLHRTLAEGWALFAPASWTGSLALLAGAALAAFALRFTTRSEWPSAGIDDEPRPSSGLVVAAVLSTLLTLTMVSAVGLAGGRFVVPLVVLLLVVLPSRALLARSDRSRRAALAAVLILATLQVWRAARWVRHASIVDSEGMTWCLELVPGCEPQSNCALGEDQVTPPTFPWVDRGWSKRSEGGARP